MLNWTVSEESRGRGERRGERRVASRQVEHFNSINNDSVAINRQTQQTQTDYAHLCLGIGRSNTLVCVRVRVCAHIIWKRACEMRSETRKWLLVVNLWTTATNQCQLEVSLLGARKWWANQVTRAGPSTSSNRNRIETESCLYFNNIIYVHVFAFNRNQKRSESKANNARAEWEE